MDPLFALIDPVMYAPFRVVGHTTLGGFFAGTAVWALVCVFIGEMTVSLGKFLVRGPLKERQEAMKRYHDLSIEALKHKDKEAHLAADKLAKEAFGKSFFLGVGLGIGSIWPCFFVLGWMQFRFGYQMEVPLGFWLPVLGTSIGYIGVFVICYVSLRIAFAVIKRRISGPKVITGESDARAADVDGNPPGV